MMRRFITFALVVLAFVGGSADAQRPRRVASPHEMAREFDRIKQQHRELAQQQNYRNRSQGYDRARSSWRLRPTAENFARVQAAAMLLELTSKQDRSGPETIIQSGNLLDGSTDTLFPHIASAVRTHRLRPKPSHAGVALVDFLPTNGEAFARVFGRNWTAKDQSDVRRAKQLARDGQPALSGSIDAALRDPDSPIVMILGHNEGGFLMTPGGTKYDIRKVSEACDRALKMCLFAICNSQALLGTKAVGMSGKLSLLSGGRLVRDIARISRDYQSDSEPGAPLFLLHDILQRVDLNGNRIRLVGYQTLDWFAVHMIVVVVQCADESSC